MNRGWIFAGCMVALFTGLAGRNAFAADRPQLCGTDPWQPIVREAAHRFDLPRAWLDAVILAESAGCPTLNGKPTVSAVGAMGLMQLMPATWREYRARLGLAEDPYQSRDNILAGAAYLHALYRRYGWNGFLAAYKAGPGRYEEFMRGARPLPRVTIEYVARVRRMIERIDAESSPDRLPTASAASPLFVVVSSDPENVDRATHGHLDAQLFVPLSPVQRPATERQK